MRNGFITIILNVKNEWLDPGQLFTSTPKRNIHGHEILLYIWWNYWCALYESNRV